jgi:hypothetical protein
MRRPEIDDGAGAAPTASGPEHAKAVSPAQPSSSFGQLAPEIASSDGKCKTEPDSTKSDLDQAQSSDRDTQAGEDVLDRVETFIRRFLALPSAEAYTAFALWLAVTHLMEAWYAAPRLAVLSPVPGSGKTRVLELATMLVPRPIFLVKPSAAYIVRKIADQANRPTVLYDEIDTVFGPNAPGSEDLRAVLNAGYRRGAKVGKCYTDKGKVLTEELHTYAAVAVAGLGELPETIASRSIILRIRKRPPDVTVERFTPHLHEAEGVALGGDLAAWAEAVFERARIAKPVVPEGIDDRDLDIWTPPLIVGELAGDRWTERAQRAALAFTEAAKSEVEPSLGVRLLLDIRRCFTGADNLPSATLIDRMLADEEAPWGDLNRRNLDQRALATMLKSFGIKPRTIRVGDKTPRGYRRVDFEEAWDSYLPPLPPGTATNETPATGEAGLDSQPQRCDDVADRERPESR